MCTVYRKITPLHIVVALFNKVSFKKKLTSIPELVQLVLRAGVDVNLRDDYGFTALNHLFLTVLYLIDSVFI